MTKQTSGEEESHLDTSLYVKRRGNWAGVMRKSAGIDVKEAADEEVEQRNKEEMFIILFVIVI